MCIRDRCIAGCERAGLFAAQARRRCFAAQSARRRRRSVCGGSSRFVLRTALLKFSIIVAAYNVERYIGECLESLKAQTFGDFECVVVNDCSQDGTLAAIESAVSGDARFSVLTLPQNSGLSAARNAGIAAAQGEFCLLYTSRCV